MKIFIQLRMFLLLTALTGLIYPLIITLIALISQKAEGDLSLIAQNFRSDHYFWGRPSAIDYNPLPSGGSNLGPTSAALKRAVEERKARYQSPDVPADLLFASGSGIDPHISKESAYFQIERVARARNLDPKLIKNLIDSLIIYPQFGFLGEPCINVLMLNRELDKL